jgi:acyl-CoA synthetase (AMP-forming)/AMP-acid ligase II
MWSKDVKAGLLRHNDRLLLVDTLGSSEAVGMASSVSSSKGGGAAGTASFRLGERTRVLSESGEEIPAGSPEPGLVALRGRTPIGYRGDEAKSAATFRVIDGVRWSIPGDWATVDADGTLRLLGRGSVCINTGGEKVYPEEVEEALKTHPAVADAVVVGLPDERFGEAITGVVQLRAPVDEAALVAHVKAHLAGYKAPKRVLTVADIGRAPNGKVDYKRWKAEAMQLVQERST